MACWDYCHLEGVVLAPMGRSVILILDVEHRRHGHTKLDTTARYTQVATNTDRNVTSPLDHLIGKIKKDELPA